MFEKIYRLIPRLTFAVIAIYFSIKMTDYIITLLESRL